MVQKFIGVPINQGQLEFDSKEGAAFGFFYEVPGTNLIIFVETLKSVALASVRELAINYVIVLSLFWALPAFCCNFLCLP